MNADPVAIARDLIRCRSITPEEGGALAYLQRVLADAGFSVYRETFKIFTRASAIQRPILFSPATPTSCRRATKRHGVTRRLPAKLLTTNFMDAARPT